MRTERVRGNEAGFTLIEVLAAMMVLAVGLLGLQALGVGAARSVARADHQSELAAVATGAIEQRQQAIRSNPAVVATGESCDTEASGVELCVRVESRSSNPALPNGTARVQVRAIHPRMVRDTFTISSYVYDPDLP